MSAFYISYRWVMTLILGALLVPMGLVLVLRSVTIFGTWPPVSVGGWAFFLGWYLAFVLGFFLPIRWGATANQAATGEAARQTSFWVITLSLAAAIGAGLMTYNFVVVRGFGFDVPIEVLRSIVIQEASAGYVGSWLGGVGRLLISAIAVAWIVTCLKWKDISWLALVVLLVSTTVVFAYQAKFEGGRFFSAAVLLASLFASVGFFVSNISHERRVRVLSVRPRHVVPVALLLLMSFGVTAYNERVFISRGVQSAKNFDRLKAEDAPVAEKTELDKLVERASPLAIAYLQYASAFDIDLSSVHDVEKTGTSYSKAMAWIYLTQGISEFDRIFRAENLKHSAGFYQFSQLAQVLSRLTGTDMRYDVAKNLPNYGTYITLPGACYLDFGMVPALLFAALAGIAFRAGVESMFAGASTFLAILTPILFVVVATGPVTTLVPNFWPCIFWIALMQIPIRTKPKEITHF